MENFWDGAELFWLCLVFLCLRIHLGSEGPWKPPGGSLLSILQQRIPTSTVSPQVEETTSLSNFYINHELANDSTAHQQSAGPGQGSWSGLENNLTVIDSRCCRKLQTSEVPFSPASGKVQGGVDAYISYFIALFSLQLRKDSLSKQNTHCLRSMSFHWAGSMGF